MFVALPSSSPITQDALCAQFIGNFDHTLIAEATLSFCFVISYTPVRVLSARHSRHRTGLRKQRFGPHFFWNVDLHLPEKARMRSETRVAVSERVFFFCTLEICFNRQKPTAVNVIALDGAAGPGEFLNDKVGPKCKISTRRITQNTVSFTPLFRKLAVVVILVRIVD
jgi:hypothetical protein